MSGDIFAGQPSDAGLLAEIYDLEHDQVVEDLAFYREMARRHRGTVLDVGCGSGRLFGSLFDGGARRVVGVDATPALLERADARIAGDARLRAAAEDGRLILVNADVRRLPRSKLRRVVGRGGARLVTCVGVLPHLDGPEAVVALLSGLAGLMARNGVLVIDDLGPAALPDRDLPLSVDWRRTVGNRSFVRRSQLMRREAPEGLRVSFSTIVDLGRPDGTIARLPASYRLWYPSIDALAALVREARMAVDVIYGSHDLEAYDADSERRIMVIRRAGD